MLDDGRAEFNTYLANITILSENEFRKLCDPSNIDFIFDGCLIIYKDNVYQFKNKKWIHLKECGCSCDELGHA